MSALETDILSVSAYATRIQRAAKQAGSAVVEGEVEKPKMTSGGAFMFELTDGESRFRAKVPPWTLRKGIEHRPKAGDLVRVQAAYPDFWPQAGTLSVMVEEIELAGDGELLRRRQQLLAKLRAEGLADPDGFPKLPRFPRAVGVIAGKDSDALKDVIRGLADRFPAARVMTACCPVQGAAAPKALIDALAQLDLNPLVDVIVIARGGGSVRDLAAFDDEGLCRAIRAITTPVITAIGHTDNDPVCNAITHAAYVPRHAAERAVPDRQQLLAELDQGALSAERAVRRFRGTVEELGTRCQTLRGLNRVRATRLKLAEQGDVLDSTTREFLVKSGECLSAARETLATVPGRARSDLATHERQLDQFQVTSERAFRLPAERLGELDRFRQGIERSGRRTLEAHKLNWQRALDRHEKSLSQASGRSLNRARGELDRDATQLTAAGRRQLQATRRETEGLLAILEASDFSRRGWLRATGSDGQAITELADVAVNDLLRLHLRGGDVEAAAKKLHPAETEEER